MAAMTPELKARYKELGIRNSCWRGPNGKNYVVCRGGEFYMHTICETYVPRRYVMGKPKCKAQGLDPDEMVKYIDMARCGSKTPNMQAVTEIFGKDNYARLMQSRINQARGGR